MSSLYRKENIFITACFESRLRNSFCCAHLSCDTLAFKLLTLSQGQGHRSKHFPKYSHSSGQLRFNSYCLKATTLELWQWPWAQHLVFTCLTVMAWLLGSLSALIQFASFIQFFFFNLDFHFLWSSACIFFSLEQWKNLSQLSPFSYEPRSDLLRDRGAESGNTFYFPF